MTPSETGYLFLLVIGFLSVAATVAVFVSACRQRHERSGELPRLGVDLTRQAFARQASKALSEIASAIGGCRPCASKPARREKMRPASA